MLPNNPKHNSKINNISMLFQKYNIIENKDLQKISYNLGYLLVKK